MRKVKPGASIPGLYPSTFTAHDIEEDKLVSSAKKRHPWDRKPVENRVEYIHPDRRFVTVRFLFDRGSFCESFSMKEDQHGE